MKTKLSTWIATGAVALLAGVPALASAHPGAESRHRDGRRHYEAEERARYEAARRRYEQELARERAHHGPVVHVHHEDCWHHVEYRRQPVHVHVHREHRPMPVQRRRAEARAEDGRERLREAVIRDRRHERRR